MDADLHPPIASIISGGHSSALSLSRIECLNEWIKHPSDTLGFSQLLIAADAELALQKPFFTYLGKKYGVSDDAIACLTAHSIADFEDNGIAVRVAGLVELLKKS